MIQTQCYFNSRWRENDVRVSIGFVEFTAHSQRATRQRTVAFEGIFQVSRKVWFSADEQTGLDRNSGIDAGS